MRVRSRRNAVLGLLALALCARARAGPCYPCPGGAALSFRDDRVLPSLPPGGTASDPDVAVQGDRAFVVFVDDAATADNPAGLAQVWFAAAAGFGCQWLDPVALSLDPASPSTAPALAVAGGCLAVVYERAGRIYTRHASLLAFPLLVFDPEEALSDAALSGPAARPDIAAIDLGGAVHVHAVWEGTGAGATAHVWHKRSLQCGQPGTWRGSSSSAGEVDLTVRSGPPDFAASRSTRPVVSVSAAAAAGQSAPAVAFLNDNGSDHPPPAGGQSLYVLRSADSGETFFGDLAAADPLPRKVDDGPAGTYRPFVTEVAIDPAEDWTWLVWSDERRPGGRDTYADAQQADAAGVGAAWSVPDFSCESGASASRQPAATAWLLPGAGEADAHAYLVQSRSGIPEVHLRRQALALAPPFIRNSCVLGGASLHALTGQSPPRPGGTAASPAAGDGLLAGSPDVPVQFVAWVDDRSGSGEIWWKSTDPLPPGAPTGLALAPSDCPVSGFGASWSAPGDCDLQSYELSYSDASTTRTLTLAATQSSVLLSGLVPDTDYTVSLRAIDEACNTGPQVTVSGRTPACPSPVLAAEPAASLRDECATSPAPGHRDGQVEPNEIIREVYLPLSNGAGAGAATLVRGTLEAHPGILLGASAASWPDLPAGAGTTPSSTPFSFQVKSTVPCGSALDLTLRVTASEIPSGTPLVFPFRVPSSGLGCDICGADARAAPRTASFLDLCNGAGSGQGNGLPDPGEALVALKLPLFNPGTSAVTSINVVSLVAVSPGVSVTQAASTYADLAPGAVEANQADFALALDPAGFRCSGSTPPLRLDLTIAYDQALAPVTLRFDLATPEPTDCGWCQAQGCPALPGAVPGLRAARSAGDVALSWASAGNAASYNVFKVMNADKSLVPAANQATASSDPAVVAACSAVPEGSKRCVDPGSVGNPPGLLFYQVRGVCADGSEGDVHPF